MKFVETREEAAKKQGQSGDAPRRSSRHVQSPDDEDPEDRVLDDVGQLAKGSMQSVDGFWRRSREQTMENGSQKSAGAAATEGIGR